MSNSLIAVIVIPIVVLVALAVWIIGVFRADRHPRTGRGRMPRREVIGGTFRASGGRQVTPTRTETAETGDEPQAADETVSPADQAPDGPQSARDADIKGRRDAGHPAGL
jgi:hypothetical protein